MCSPLLLCPFLLPPPILVGSCHRRSPPGILDRKLIHTIRTAVDSVGRHLRPSHTLTAEVAAARFTVPVERLTQGVVAFFARVTIFGVDGITTVRAGHTIPIRKRHVRTATVVGQQNVVDDQKEVSNSALLQ